MEGFNSQSLHPRDGVVAFGSRDSDYPALVRLAIAYIVASDAYNLVSVFDTKGTVELGIVVESHLVGFSLGEVAPGTAGVF